MDPSGILPFGGFKGSKNKDLESLGNAGSDLL
jgi:hypothetical protein